MLDWLKKNTAGARENLGLQVSRYKNRGFMEAVASGCALVANADGAVTPDEKRKMVGYMSMSEEMKVFETDEVIAAFNKANEKFDFDMEIGRIEALKTIGKLKGKDAEAQTMVRVCCVIGAADGNFDEHERKAVRDISNAVGLDPKIFDL